MPDAVTHLNAALEGRYAIERELGEGGMATVYLADDLKHERKVALKVLKPELAAVLGAERFLAEIKTTANLQHPHILPLFDSGSADAFLYYVMPYVAGETLKHKLDRQGQLRIEECLAIGRSVAAALHYAHGQNVVHRDIKPENVMLSDGLPVVADFGIAGALDAACGDRLTRTGVSLGTPGYQSPEQAAGDPVDARSDVYALGCLMFEMVTDRLPYQGPTAQAVLAKLFTEPVPSARGLRDGVPETLDAALRRALAKEPGDRFATADELGHLGSALLDDITIGCAEYFLPGDLRGWIDWSERNIDGWLAVGPWGHIGRMWAALGKFLLGDWDGARADAARATQGFPADNYWTGCYPAVQLLIDAYAGTGDPAELFRLNYDRLPKPGEPAFGGDRLFALVATEALAVIGDREACASLYPAALDTVEGGVTLWYPGLGQRYLGISAACGEQWDVAERHFQKALEQANEMPVRSEQPEVRRWYARMLLDRGQPGDEDRARELLDEATVMYEEIGMPRHLEMAREML